ncbi:inositol monophosphatase family protein [Evansella sp. AB-P1]|uniref:inositol monophosphatase family protein n=1 Tax=Evansella sp. AB-P1 TaxID=3037653 RepID=UPI00241F454C|nr:inositol monophosphatase family protein [Evansella sp. AB-P1]MDG5789470.1 inositol monophosphatase family protein [Evansella sp. AB-P1]
MSDINWKLVHDTAIEWTSEAGQYIRSKMKESFSVSTKAHQDDLVTDVDKAVEDFFKNKIVETFPNHRLMGEEGSYESVKDLEGIVWILDPIDGTVNFVHQESFFAISIGIFHEGIGMVGIVYDVMRDELFTSIKGNGAYINGNQIKPLTKTSLNESILSFNHGWVLKDRRLEELVKEARAIRCYGSAALEIAYVAAGRLDAYISFNLAPWDFAGGSVILKEVGGLATNYEGKELTFLDKDTFIAANPSIHHDIFERFLK